MCKRLRPVLFLPLFLCAFGTARAQVSGVTAIPDPVCAGNSLTVGFTAGAADVGVDTLFLKNASGALIYLGTANVAAAGLASVIATVPDTFSGRYTVNIKSVSGAVVESGDTLDVIPRPTVTITPTSICSGAPGNFTLSSNGGGGTAFFLTPGTATGVNGTLSQIAVGSDQLSGVLTAADNVSAGTIVSNVTATTLGGCTSPLTPLTVTVNPKPTITSATPASAVCSGVTLNVPLTASTAGPNTFKWTSTATDVTDPADQLTFVPGPISEVLTATLGAVGTITYLVTPKSAAGCEGDPTNFSITVNPRPTITSAAPASPVCSGATLSVPLTASTAGQNSFTWTSTSTGVVDPADQLTFVTGPISETLTATSNSAAGSISYTVTPRSGANCVGDPATFLLTVNPAPAVSSAAPASPICSGGAINIPLTASTNGVNTFTWLATQTGVTGATSPSPVFGAGPINNTLTATSNSTAGLVSYAVRAKSAVGCEGNPTTFNVSVNPTPALATAAPNSPVCSGTLVNIPLTTTTAGAGTFTWISTQTGVTGATSQSPTFAAGPINNTLTNPSNSAAGTVSYQITPRSAAGCTGLPTTFNIAVNPLPVLTTAPPASPICSGAMLTIPLTATTTGTSTFTWVPTQTGVTGATTQSPTFAVGPISSTITNTSNSTPGTVAYLITPRSAAGCTGAGVSFSVTVNPAPAVTSVAPTTALCSGNTLTLPLTASTPGVNTFTWTNTATLVTGASTQSGALATGPISDVLVNTTNNTAGSVTYNITAKSSLGCTGATQSIIVNVNPAPVVTTTAPTAAACSGVPFTLLLTASTPGASTFTWVPTQNGASGASSQSPAFASGPISNTLFTTSLQHNTPGSVSYLVTPKSAAGCTGLGTALLVNVNPDPIISSVPPAPFACSGAPYSFSPVASTGPGSTFRWSVVSSNILPITGSSAFVSGPISNTLTTTSPLVQGTVSYSITAKSAGGCIALDSTTYTVQVLPLPRLLTRLDSVCSGTLYNAPFTSTAFPAGTYSWSIIGSYPNLSIAGASSGNSFSGPSNTFTYNSPSYGFSDTVRYAVTITTTGGANGCVGLDTFRVRVRPRPVITNTNPAHICSGSPVAILLKSSVIDSNNVTFNWSYSGNNTSNNGGQTLCVGCSAITQTLNATSNVQGTAVYNVTGFYFGCASTAPAPITVTVNPRPRVTGIQPPTSVCSGTITNIALNSSVASNFTWTTNTVLGNAQVTGNSSGNTILDTLRNLSNTTPAQVQFIVTPVSQVAGCSGFDTSFFITINPTPVFIPSNFTLCSGDSTSINLLNATSTGGTGTWQWTFTAGANASGGSSVGTFVPASVIRQQLLNGSNSARTFGVYSIRARSVAGCESVIANDTVFINPLPILTSRRDTSICSDSVLVYNVQASTGASTKYSWLKVGNFGAPGNPTSFQFIGVPLTDSLNTGGVLSPRDVTYNIFLRSNEGCNADTSVVTRPQLKVTINPTPDTVGVSVSPAKICEGAEMLNFTARRAPVSPEKFTWGVSAGSVYHLSGENALISFPVPGSHTVFVTSSVPGFSCSSKPQPRSVSVDPGAVRKPNVVRFGNSLVCLTGNTGGTITNYQWGYDLKQNLDSVLLAGEIFQSYVFTTLDTTNRAYWVMANYAEGDCSYKAYFNRLPTLGIGNLQSGTAMLSMVVFPNPAHAQLNVELPRLSSKVQLEVIDLAGRKAMPARSASGNTTLDIANLMPGCYFLNCYQDGQRIATARFIKN